MLNVTSVNEMAIPEKKNKKTKNNKQSNRNLASIQVSFTSLVLAFARSPFLDLILVSNSFLAPSSKALVTSSDALVTSSFLFAIPWCFWVLGRLDNAS